MQMKKKILLSILLLTGISTFISAQQVMTRWRHQEAFKCIQHGKQRENQLNCILTPSPEEPWLPIWVATPCF